ncbi:uncharacterized protein TNCV_2844021 [Trichonephila clavipes]|nr:uncharacterized protein TNCV_2844021 [Trichonephila clavipes]
MLLPYANPRVYPGGLFDAYQADQYQNYKFNFTDIFPPFISISVGTPCQLYASSPHPVFSPNMNCLSNRMHPAFSTEFTLPLYSMYEESPKPPEYDTLSPEQQLPPTFMEIVPAVLVNRQPRTEETGRQTTYNSV